MSSRPAISVLMAVRNGEPFLAEAVESVLGQDFTDLELIAVDDGSEDSTPQILERLAAADSRLVVHRREHGRNVVEALNVAAELSRGHILARLDADDVALPGRFQRQAEFLDRNPEVALLGGQALLIDERGREFGRAEYPTGNAELQEALRDRNPIVSSAVAMRREVFEAVGGYRFNFDHAEDLDLWLRLAAGRRIANLPDFVVKYRIHGNQATLRKQDEQALYSLAARASARARAAGDPDPFEGASIDEELLVSQGISRDEQTAAVVPALTWLARTTGRAGHHEDARRIFGAALERARSDSGSPALVASVHRSMGHRHAEQGQRFRAKLKAAQARLIESRGR